MSRMSEHHQKLDENGVGKCSAPMWMNGVPAGFCDNNAYGFRPNCKEYTRWDGERIRTDGLYAGYVPGLACPNHGGPSKCEVCGEAYHQGDLSQVFKHEHKGLPLDDVMGINGKKIND